MEKRLTDKEIVKALECCSVGTFACDEECPCFHSKSNLKLTSCRFELLGDALDLINRLQATIDSFTDIGKLYSEIKAEAYKEFAELIKKDFENPYIQKSGLDFVDFLKGIVDNRLKRMVGDDKCS